MTENLLKRKCCDSWWPRDQHAMSCVHYEEGLGVWARSVPNGTPPPPDFDCCLYGEHRLHSPEDFEDEPWSPYANRVVSDYAEVHRKAAQEWLEAMETMREQRAVDRTFENEVRLNPRKTEDWVF